MNTRLVLDYLEEKRNPHRESYNNFKTKYNALMKRLDSNLLFIHFSNTFNDTKGQDINQIGINVQQSYTNPFGIYAYHLNEYRDGLFKTDSEYAYIIKVKEDKSKPWALNLPDMPIAEYSRCIGILRKYFDTDGEALEFEKKTEQLSKNKSYGGILFYMIVRLSDGNNKRQNMIWTKDLGYHYIADRVGIIHPSEPQQICFFSSKYYDVIDVIDMSVTGNFTVNTSLDALADIIGTFEKGSRFNATKIHPYMRRFTADQISSKLNEILPQMDRSKQEQIGVALEQIAIDNIEPYKVYRIAMEVVKNNRIWQVSLAIVASLFRSSRAFREYMEYVNEHADTRMNIKHGYLLNGVSIDDIIKLMYGRSNASLYSEMFLNDVFSKLDTESQEIILEYIVEYLETYGYPIEDDILINKMKHLMQNTHIEENNMNTFVHLAEQYLIENMSTQMDSISLEDVAGWYDFEAYTDLYPGYSDEETIDSDDCAFETKEHAEEYFTEVLDIFQSFAQESMIRIYRCLHVKSLSNLELDAYAIGDSWTWDKETAWSFGRNQNRGNVVIEAEIPPDGIDFENSIKTYMQFNQMDSYDERELTVGDPEKLTVVGIELAKRYRIPPITKDEFDMLPQTNFELFTKTL